MAKAGGVLRDWSVLVCWGVGLTLVAGCGERLPPTSPGPPAAAVPEEIPESARYPVVSQCEGVTIRVGAPRRIDERTHQTCGEEYAVDFVVEGGSEDAMLLDLFQSHTLWDWRAEVRGGGVRHEFTLRMAPWSRNPGPFVPTLAGLRWHEPIVLQRCPAGEGEGSVLACTNRGCGIYDDVLEVPPLEPEDLELAFTVPPEYMNPQSIREGETVWVPLTYRVYRPLTEEVTLRVGVEVYYRDKSLGSFVDMEVHPEEIRLPAGWTRTETPLLAVRVTDVDFEALTPTVPFRVTLERTWDLDRCVSVSQQWILFNIEEPE